MLKILYADCLGLSVVNSAQWTIEICPPPKIAKKSIKTSILAFKVIQSLNSVAIDFVLVINSNLGPISHSY